MDFPMQQSGAAQNRPTFNPGKFDMRDALNPRRLTIVMWDQAFLMRHVKGESFEDYERVLDGTLERVYNTLRLDPLPQLMDLAHPKKVFRWGDPHTPYMPWGWNKPGEGPLGQYMIDFMQQVQRRQFNYTLSAWWFNDQSGSNPFPPESVAPHTFPEAAELWAKLLRQWKARFGFDGLQYVDICNEVPYFLPGLLARIKNESGQSWTGDQHEDVGATFSPELIRMMSGEMNAALSALQREFPEVRFTASIHGDERWLDIPVQFDCLDVHFYADIDSRWRDRVRFPDWMATLFTDNSWHQEFSDRCAAARKSIVPMLRAAQRSKLASFAAWAEQKGMPLTTSESWASWFYLDSPTLDWSWLLEWAEWSVEDALEFHMWGWTPHNYCQPQFANWQDVRWHRRLTDRFIRS